MFHTIIVTVAFYRYSQTPFLSLMNYAGYYLDSFCPAFFAFPLCTRRCTSRIKYSQIQFSDWFKCIILLRKVRLDGS